MSLIKLLVFLLVPCFIFSACNNNPPVSLIQGPEVHGLGAINWFGRSDWPAGGSLSLGADGPNTEVIQENILTVSIELLGSACYVPRLVTGALGSTALDSTVRVDGRPGSGYVDVSGSISGEPYDYAFQFTATFHDYSLDGELFMGGTLNYKGNAGFTPGATDSHYEELTINGSLDFSGKYSGSIACRSVSRFRTSWSERYSGSLLVRSGGNWLPYSLNYSTYKGTPVF